MKHLAARALLWTLALLTGLVFQASAKTTGPVRVVVGDARPRLGQPCEELHYYRATLVVQAEGARAVFALAGGQTEGSLPLTPDQEDMMRSHDAYVADVQLGTFEPSSAGDAGSPLTCRLNPTYHFYCPADGAMDRLCLTWVGRQSPATGSREAPLALRRG